MTGSDWVARAKSIHKGRYDYSKVDYVNSTSKVIITCSEHGDFEQQANSHMRGRGCPDCWGRRRGESQRLDTDIFLRKAKNAHGSTYDYTNTKYENSSKKLVINCKKHGEFLQLPSHHMNGHGCPYCGNTVKKTLEGFIRDSVEVHGNTYDYSLVKYKTNTTKVKIVCKEHGVFTQAPANHISSKQGCPKCANNKPYTNEEFIKLATAKHDSKYDYSKTEYLSSKQIIKIICPKHGEFQQSPNSHLRGHGCNKCAIRGYNKGRFTAMSGIATLYALRLYDENESFLKIGITTKAIKKRAENPRFPYKHDLMFALKLDSGEAFDLEKKIHKALAKKRYTPSLDFKGKTECFLLNKQEALLLSSHLNSFMRIIC